MSCSIQFITLGSEVSKKLNSDEIWNIADKTGTVLTIAGFFLAIVTLVLAGSISRALKNKVRVSEAVSDLSALVSEIRGVLKEWDKVERSSVQDLTMMEQCNRTINTMLYQAIAHVQNIRPRLDSIQKKSADEVVGSIFLKKGYLWWATEEYKVVSSSSAWDVHNKLQGFSVHLQGLVKDRAAGGI